jgi:hypothetical protein
MSDTPQQACPGDQPQGFMPLGRLEAIYAQEVNRRFFHPLGYHLHVDGRGQLVIEDWRHLPPGPRYPIEALDRNAALTVDQEMVARQDAQLAEYGWRGFQPVPGYHY